MTQYVQLSADTTQVITLYGSPQLITSDKPGYSVIADTDPRYLAFASMQEGLASYFVAVASGVQITSTGTPALNSSYALDQNTRSNITAEQVYIATTSKFTNGQTSRAWPDIAGAFHLFSTTAEFTAFAEAVAQYYDSLATALATVQAGGEWVAPSMPAAIP